MSFCTSHAGILCSNELTQLTHKSNKVFYEIRVAPSNETEPIDCSIPNAFLFDLQPLNLKFNFFQIMD